MSASPLLAVSWDRITSGDTFLVSGYRKIIEIETISVICLNVRVKEDYCDRISSGDLIHI